MALADTADYDEFVVAVKDAVMAGPAGEAALVAALAGLTDPGRFTKVVAVLGDAQGSGGVPALIEILGRRRLSIDSRCAALLALAKRYGAAASAVLAAHLTHHDDNVRCYAVRGLAVVGDGRAWTEALSLLRDELDRPVPGVSSPDMSSLSRTFEAMVIIAYLVRHLDDARTTSLATVIRDNVDRFHAAERDWLSRHWPTVLPDGPPVPDIDPPNWKAFQDWARDPLFGPVH